MITELNQNEIRVIGSLIEKSIVTPDQYPLTLNALTNACNQKTSRDPVMSLSQGEVLRAVRDLQDKHLVMVDENFKARTEKYSQRFCNTRYSELQFDAAQLAVVCLLLLRGPQTPGELRARSGRLHTFDENQAVVDTLRTLMESDDDPLVVQLPRTPGRKDAEYMHLFGGPIDVDAYAAAQPAAKAPARAPSGGVAALTERVEALESEVAELKRMLSELTG